MKVLEGGNEYQLTLWQKWSVVPDTQVIKAGTYVRVEVTTTVPISDVTVEELVSFLDESTYYRVSNELVVLELTAEIDTTLIEQAAHYVPMLNTLLEYKGEDARIKDITMATIETNILPVALAGGAAVIVIGIFLLIRKK